MGSRILGLFAPGEGLTSKQMAERLDLPVPAISSCVSTMVHANLMHVVQPAPGVHDRWPRYAPGSPPPPSSDQGTDDQAIIHAIRLGGSLTPADIRGRLGADRITLSKIEHRLRLLAGRGELRRLGRGKWAIATADLPKGGTADPAPPGSRRDRRDGLRGPGIAATPDFAAALTEEVKRLGDLRGRLLGALHGCEEEAVRLRAALSDADRRARAVQALLGAYAVTPPDRPVHEGGGL